MKTLTIRGLPEQVHVRLKEQAKRNRRSLNQEIIAELSDVRSEREDFVEKMLAASDEVQKGVLRPITHEEERAFLSQEREAREWR